MEDNVRAHYICWRCDHQYVEFNIQEGEPAKCPQCKTLNYPGYEVRNFSFYIISKDILTENVLNNDINAVWCKFPHIFQRTFHFESIDTN